MFDVSFGELLLVLVIGLIVLGPKRLPEAIKHVASWIKALRRISASVQLELNKELKLQELQDSLRKAEQSGLDKITPEIKASIDDLKRVTDAMQKDLSAVAKQADLNEESSVNQTSIAQQNESTVEDKPTVLAESQAIQGKEDNV